MEAAENNEVRHGLRLAVASLAAVLRSSLPVEIDTLPCSSRRTAAGTARP